MILSIEAKKAFEKVQHSFLIETPNKIGIEGTFINIIKATYERTTTNISLNGGELRAIPLESGARQEYPFSTMLGVL